MNTVAAPKEHFLYLNLVHFLSPLFPKVSRQTLNSLNEAAYNYFRFLLSLDDFLDISTACDKKQKLYNLLSSLENCEEAIKTLSTLFDKQSDFWLFFQSYKKSYFNTIVLEKELSTAAANVSEELFVRIAQGKSAICLNVAHALSILGDNTSNNENVIQCINELHIAIQYVDDIDDFKKDIQEGQWTYPHSVLKKYLLKKGISWDEINLENKHKHLFLSGTTTVCLRKAIYHYQNAREITQNLGLRDFEVFLNKQIKNLEGRIEEIDFLIQKTHTKLSKSRIFIQENTLDEALSKSKGYLVQSLDDGYTWSDFMTSAGMGKAWITGYVAMLLNEFECDFSNLGVLRQRIVENPKQYLSYNRGVLEDADSSNFIVGFIGKNELISVPQWAEILDNWLLFKNLDGGWATYKDGFKLRQRLELPDDVSVSGWLQAHNCVSAVSAYVLYKIGLIEEYTATCKYLLQRQKEDGSWESYWWTSPTYATAWSIMALSLNNQHKNICRNSAQFLANHQTKDGTWLNPYDKDNSAFYTALSLKALISADKYEFKTNIEKGIGWLLANQTEDGSWESSKILQIPATEVMKPKDIHQWRNSSFGVNCVTDDYNRVFTTVTVWNLLKAYQSEKRAITRPSYLSPLTF